MRLLGQTLFAATTIGLALTVAPACVDNDQSIYIRQVMAPPLTRQGGSCSYLADPAQPQLLGGTADALLTGSYQAILLVGNQMIQRTDNLSARSESNKAHIEGAVVQVTDANGNELAEFTSPATGFVDAANGNISNFGLFAVTVIDVPTMTRIAAGLAPNESRLMLANIKVFGETLGGVDLESGEFQLTVRVCKGCLISFAGADDPTVDGVDCNLAGQTTAGGGTSTTPTEPPCNLGQDEPVPCSLCRGYTIPNTDTKPCDVQVE